MRGGGDGVLIHGGVEGEVLLMRVKEKGAGLCQIMNSNTGGGGKGKGGI